MGVHEMLPVIFVAAALWLIVYCLIVAQRCSAHSKYASDVRVPPQPAGKTKRLPVETEKALFAYYL